MASKRVKVQRQKAVSKIAVTKAPAILGADQYEPAVNAAAQTKYAGAQSQLAAAQRAQQARGGQIAAWYENYRNAVAQAGSANQAAAQQAQGNLTALGNAAAANDRAGQAQVTSQMQADAASRGASVDPALAAQMQMGSQVRGGNLAGSQALQSAQAFNQGTVDRQRGVAGEGSKVAALLDNAGKISALQGQGVDLAGQIGAFRTQYKDQLKEEERKQAVDDQTAALQQFVATGKLDVAKDTLKVKTVQGQTQAKTAEQKRADAANAVNSYGYSKSAWEAMTPAQRRAAMVDLKKETSQATAKPKTAKKVKPTTGPGSLTSAEESKRAGTVTKLVEALKGGKTPDELTSTGPYSPEVNATLVRAAMDVKAYGGVTPATVERLHKAGIRVQGNFKQVSRAQAVAKQRQPKQAGIGSLLPAGPLHDALGGG